MLLAIKPIYCYTDARLKFCMKGSMRLEYIKPFTEASNEILSGYIGGSIGSSSVSLCGELTHISGVAAVVALSNDIVGHVIIDMTEDTAIKVVGMMSHAQPDGLNSLALSTIQELINLIAALSVTKLEGAGYDVNISPPLIIRGKGAEVSITKSESLHVKIDTSVGDLNILVAVESEKE